MNQESIEIIATLLGGLALFIFGMNLMSDGLQKAAGDKMKSVLALLTKNPVMGVLAGALCTAVLQSSSATTVLVIGFVSAGLMKLPQAVSVILGANVGTTITAQLIAFKIGDYAWIFVFVGFFMYFFIKRKEMVNNLGQILFAFGLLFVGINTMGAVMKPLASSPFFTELMLQIQDVPVLGVAIGTLMTVVVQSSSATIAVLQNLASTAEPDGVTSIIGLEGSLPILFGDNIGTTITALFASIGASINAKRTALAHVVFNLSGTLIFIWFIPWIANLVRIISPSGSEVDIIARQIANAHLLFNLTNTILWLPFIWLLVKIVTKLLPGKDSDRIPEEPIFLDFNIIDRPIFAIHLATKELTRLATFAKEMVVNGKKAFLGNDIEAANQVLSMENSVNKLQGKIVNYLSSILTSEGSTEHQAETVSRLMHVAADIEHIGDHCENIAELAIEKTKNKYDFSDTASAEIYECFDQVSRMVSHTIEALDNGDVNLAKTIMEEENEIDKTEERLRSKHMQRLYDNTCSPAFTVIYTDIVHNIEKIGDYCNNVARAILDDSTHFKSKIEEIEKPE